MPRYRLLALFTLLLTAASTATPWARQAPVEERFPELPQNPYCLRAACGFGRDGIPEPYAGGGLAGRSAKLAAAAETGVFAASGMVMRAWLSPVDMVGEPVTANDIWGYTSPRGREYAIVGLATGTAFVEVTDADNPVTVAFIRGAASLWRDMAVYDEFAYSVNEGGDGVQIIDLRRIDRGKVRLVGTVTTRGLWTIHNIAVNEDSGYAYLLGSNLDRGGLLALDLSDPKTPRLEPVAWQTAYVHDVLVVSYAKGPYAGREIAFAFTGPMGLHIIDVTDKGSPRTISHLRYANATYAHSGALSEDRRFLYVNDELDERLNRGVTGMTTYVIRVRNLENPRLARRVQWDANVIDHNSMVQGDRLYISSYTGGLRMIDIRRGGRPRASGFFDTHPESEMPSFTGAWGVFAGFPSGNVIVSDIQRGLFVVRPR